MIYKLGSKGEEVKTIQRALRAAGYQVSIDGDYGQKTMAAVKAFQQSRKLVPVDGIVGPATMKKLQELLTAPATTVPSGFSDGSITKAPINTHISFSVGRQVKYIAIHYTAGRSSRSGMAMQTRSVFLQRQASADFVVDDEQIVQVNPDPRNYYCWAVGDKKNPWTGGARLYGKATNRNTISIEICSTLQAGTSASVPTHPGWSFTQQALGNARRLVRHLMQTYGIPRENVIRHYDATGKLCPGIPGWNDGPLYQTDGKPATGKSNSQQWQAFLNSL